MRIAYRGSLKLSLRGPGKSKFSENRGEVVFLSETYEENSNLKEFDSFRSSVKLRRKKSGGKIFSRFKFNGKAVNADSSFSGEEENSSSNEISISSTRNRHSFKSRSTMGLRHTNNERSLKKKQRVVKMLFVVVLEFFVCWTPLYVVNTLALFRPELVYAGIGYKTISFCQLLAYTSGCCNPITYCFMSKGFRHSFINLFAFCRRR